MSKAIDLEQPLSDEDRAWLKERSLIHEIEANDRLFGKDEPEEPEIDEELGSQKLVTTAAKQFWEPGTEPETKYVQRPYDAQVTGHFAPEVTPEGAQAGTQSAEAEEDIQYLTIDELKEELRARDLSTSGNKETLVNRLQDAVDKGL